MRIIFVRVLLAVAAFSVAFTAGTLARQLPAHAATVAASPAADAAACAAVYRYHHIAATYRGDDVAWANRVWLHAWHLAGYADTLAGDSMRYNIRRYLATGRGWPAVVYDCQPDA